MLNIFPYIFSTTFNVISKNMDLIDNIVDNVVNNLVNSDFMGNLMSNIENMSDVNVNFKEHKRGYTIECYLPGVKKENINLEYDNNYISLQIKRNMFYTNNQNVAMAVIKPGGDVEEDYYVENVDYNNIKAAFKNNMLRVIVPKNTYIDKDTTIIEISDYTS